MKKSFIKAAAIVISTLAIVLAISLYDSEKFAEPIIGYSEAVTQIPLDSMWNDTEEQPTTAVISLSEIKSKPQESETSISKASETTNKTDKSTELININTATAEELKQLKGIGDVIAERIVKYAQTVGFNTIEDIKNIKGIGDKKFEVIKDKITV